jgi:hypothetical protein
MSSAESNMTSRCSTTVWKLLIYSNLIMFCIVLNFQGLGYVGCFNSDLIRICESLNTWQDFLDGKSLYYNLCRITKHKTTKIQRLWWTLFITYMSLFSNLCAYSIHTIFILLSLFWKNKSRHMWSPCRLWVYVCMSDNFWIPESVFMKLGKYIMPQ